MPTKRGGYFLKDGTRVPSVTTILSRFKESGNLIHWAWDLGIKGQDYRDVRDRAADVGNIAHDAVESWIRGREINFGDIPELADKARIAYGAFLAWAAQVQLKVTDTEIPLISERYKFGGTPDAFTIAGKRAVLDWKTSNKCYPDYLMQVAAYGRLWDENFPEDPIVAGHYLLRFDKKYGDFHEHWWLNLDSAWNMFLHLRQAYSYEKELKERVG